MDNTIHTVQFVFIVDLSVKLNMCAFFAYFHKSHFCGVIRKNGLSDSPGHSHSIRHGYCKAQQGSGLVSWSETYWEWLVLWLLSFEFCGGHLITISIPPRLIVHDK